MAGLFFTAAAEDLIDPISVSVTITNNTTVNASDLKIVLKGAGTITKATGGYAGESVTGLNTGTIDLDFGSGNVVGAKGSTNFPTSNKFTFSFTGYSGFMSANWTDSVGDVITPAIQIGTDISLALGAPLPNGSIPTSVVFANPSSADGLSLSNYAFATASGAFDLFTQDPSTLSFGPPIAETVSAGSNAVTFVGDLMPGTSVVTEGTGQVGGELPYTYFTSQQVPVPEPSSMILLATGCLGLWRWRCRRRRRACC